MFETHNSSELSIPVDLSLDGLRAWSSVHIPHQLPWFHVQYMNRGADISQIVFLSDIDQLLQLQEKTNMKILEVNLVSSGHVNNRGTWGMELLKEIWIGFEPDTKHEQHALTFVLKNGDRYTDSELDTDEENLIKKEIIFST